ncbi:unnamed protein product [Symbiodinium sp. CCMP2592]|nr:unnamed protein product [Symbiodinium sp. CCMP2592]
MMGMPQYAYIAHRSTLEAISRVAEHCAMVRTLVRKQALTIWDKYQGAVRSPCVGGAQLSIDLSKAFDLLPRQVLHEILQSTDLQPEERQILLDWHQLGKYRIKSRGSASEAYVDIKCGVRQGCVLSPTLWGLFTRVIQQHLDQELGVQWTAQKGTFFADDMHFKWFFKAVAELHQVRTEVLCIFRVLRSLGMKANAEKSKFIISARGQQASKWMKRWIRKDTEGVKHLFFGGAKTDKIPVATHFTYLGVVLSYNNFELATVRHRIGVAAGHRERLRKVLRAHRVLSVGHRLRLWRIMIQTSQLYAIEAVGLTAEAAKLLHVQTMRHLRAIIGSARHVDGDSDQLFMLKNHLPDCVELVRARCDTLCDRLAGTPPEVPCYDAAAILQWATQVRDSLPEPYVAKSRKPLPRPVSQPPADPSSTAAGPATHLNNTVETAPPPRSGPDLADPSVDRDAELSLQANPTATSTFVCSQCSQVFPNLHDLKTHEGRAHKIVRDKVAVQQVVHGYNGFPVCRHCGAQFSKWASLVRHVARQGCPAIERGELEAYAKSQSEPEVQPHIARPIVRDTIVQKGWEALLEHCDLCVELKQRCALCFQWFSSANAVRKHLRDQHSTDFRAHAEAIDKQTAHWKSYITSPCQVCSSVIVDRKQHAGQCIPLLQLMLMSCVLVGHCTSRVGPAGSSEAGTGAVGRSASLSARGDGGTVKGSSGMGHGEKQKAKDRGQSGQSRLSFGKQGQEQQQRQRQGEGQGQGTLGLVDHSNCVQLDTSFLMTMKNKKGPENLPPVMYSVWARWKKIQAETPSKLDKPLRSSMLIALLTEMKTRAEKLMKDDKQQERLRSLEWIDADGRWVYRKWSPTQEALYLDTTRKPVTQEVFVGQLTQALELLVNPNNLTRFQAMRELTPEMKGYSVAFDVAVGLRAEAEPLHRFFMEWTDLQAWALGAIRTRQHRFKRPPAAQLANPNNQCYINATVLACGFWFAPKLAMAGDNMFLRALASLQGLGFSKEHNILHLFAWRPLFVGWSRPSSQHDASELLVHLTCKGSTVPWVSRWQAGAWLGDAFELEDSGSGIIAMPIPAGFSGGAGDERCTLRECVATWHSKPSRIWANKTCYSCIHEFETRVCIVLQRFQVLDTTVQKCQLPVQVDAECDLPMFRAGSIAWVTFKARAVTYHIGDAPTSGHYRSILFHDDGPLRSAVHPEGLPDLAGTASLALEYQVDETLGHSSAIHTPFAVYACSLRRAARSQVMGRHPESRALGLSDQWDVVSDIFAVAAAVGRQPRGVTHQASKTRHPFDVPSNFDMGNIQEEALRATMDPEDRKVMEGKNFLLFQEIPRDMANFLGSSGRLVSMFLTLLKATARWSKHLVEASCRRAVQDQEIAKAVWSETMEQVEKSWLKGPFSWEEIDKKYQGCWVPSKRFGVAQADKVRSVDDFFLGTFFHWCYNGWGVVLQASILLGRVDHWKGSPGLESREGPASFGRALDLKAAYKQLARHPDDGWVSVLAVLDPNKDVVHYFEAVALPFGAVSAVTGFNRTARALRKVLTNLFFLITTNFYDDYCQMELEPLRDSAREIAEAVLDLLGWKIAQGIKALPFSQSFNMLGACISFENAYKGEVVVRNKEGRLEAIEEVVNQCLAKRRCDPKAILSIKGKLLFAAGNVFGKCAQIATQLISQCGSEGFRMGRERTDELLVALQFALNTLKSSGARCVGAWSQQPPVLVFTDGACEQEGSLVTHGALLYDPVSGRKEVFGDHIPGSLVAAWKRGGPKQVIYFAEIFPVVVAKATWKDVIVNATSLLMQSAKLDVESRALGWYSRVPSKNALGARGDESSVFAERPEFTFPVQCASQPLCRRKFQKPQETEEQQLQLLATRYDILLSHAYECSSLGRLLKDKCETDRVSLVAEALGGKALSTLKKRLSSLARLVGWCSNQGMSAFPIDSQVLIEYTQHLQQSGASHSVFGSCIEACNFARFILGVDATGEPHKHPLVQGRLRKVRFNRPPRVQARPFQVREVAYLEAFVQDSRRDARDRYAAGACLFCIHSRARVGDVRAVKAMFIDFAEGEGFLECISTSHKCASTGNPLGLELSLVAPERGVGQGLWAKAWVEVWRLSGHPVATGSCSLPLLQSPMLNGSWSGRRIPTGRFVTWISSILKSGDESMGFDLKGHSCKHTALSWASKTDMSKDSCTILGHHSLKDRRSVVTYSRDIQAGPLRELCQMYCDIRCGRYLPDMTRPGSACDSEALPCANAFASEPGLSDQRDASDDDTPFGRAVDSLIHSAERAAWEDPDAAFEDDRSQGEEPDSSSSSESSSDSGSSDSEIDEVLTASQADPPVGQRYHDRCPVYQQKNTRTLHLKPAGSSMERFICGRDITAAFEERAKECGLTQAELDVLVRKGLTSLSLLAFSVSTPGEVPQEAELRSILDPADPTTVPLRALSALRRLMFEAQTLSIAQLKSSIEGEGEKKAELAPAERTNRITDQRKRLVGLSLTGPLENAFSNYTYVAQVVDQDCLSYLEPHRFLTRAMEVNREKPGKELILDEGSRMSIRDKAHKDKCGIQNELQLSEALCRRALACDLLQLCTFASMDLWHRHLLAKLSEQPPPYYAKVSMEQLLRCDKAAWVRMSELLTSLKKDDAGNLPMDAALDKLQYDPKIMMHLAPLPGAKWKGDGKGDKGTKRDADGKPKLPPHRPGKGAGKGKCPEALSDSGLKHNCVFRHGGVVGLTNTCRSFPQSVILAISWAVQHGGPKLTDFTFCSISLNLNVKTEVHRDVNNDDADNLVLGVTDFSGGHIWVQSESGSHALPVNGSLVPGDLYDVAAAPVRFYARKRLHCTMPWTGDRLVLILFSGGDATQLPSLDFEHLKSLGFRPSVSASTVNPPLAYVPPPAGALEPLLSKVSDKVKGVPLDSLMFLDVFCGSGGLCAALRQLGMKLSVGLDRHAQRGCKCPVVSLDLTKPGSRAILLDLLRQPHVVACHLSPPVTTSCVGLAGPRPSGLRNAAHPEGLPGLQGADLDLVNGANALFAMCAEVWHFCWSHGVFCSIAHPSRSIMWLTASLRSCQSSPFLSTSLHQCMFGSYRRKATRLLHTVPFLQKLGVTCDGAHAHEPWRSPASNRAKDAGLPPMLCKSFAQALVDQLLACGARGPACSLANASLSLSLGARVTTAAQPSGRKIPPLVPEFSRTVKVSGPADQLPCTSKTKLLSAWTVPKTVFCAPFLSSLPAGSKCLRASPYAPRGMAPTSEPATFASTSEPTAGAEPCSSAAGAEPCSSAAGIPTIVMGVGLGSPDSPNTLCRPAPALPEAVEGVVLGSPDPLVPRCQPAPALPLPAASAVSATPNVKSGLELLFGIPWSPSEFVEQACNAKHPRSLDQGVPIGMSACIDHLCEHSSVIVARERTAELRKWMLRKKELDESFDGPEHCKKILAGKPLKLFGEMVKAAGHADANLVRDIQNGFDLLGEIPSSSVLPKKTTVASLSIEDVRIATPANQRAIWEATRTCRDPEIASEVYRLTLEERDKGWLTGPFSLADVPETAIVTRRFGVRQGVTTTANGVAAKIRPIDDFTESLANLTCTCAETIDPHSVNVIVAGILRRCRLLRKSGKDFPLASSYDRSA